MPSAERNVKFPSNLMEVDRYTAENVTLNEEIQGDIKLTSFDIYPSFTSFFFFMFVFFDALTINHNKQKAHFYTFTIV